MPSRLAVALLGISFASGSGNCQPPTTPGPEHFEITAADGRVVIAADDVLAYEWASHTLTLKPKVRRNLFDALKRKLVHGEPFIVRVGSKAVYQGNWKSSLSSIPCTTPVIVLDRRALDPKFGEDQVRIELGYPSKDFFKGEDPRGDQRVRNALEVSGKLTQDRPKKQAPRTLERLQSETQAERKPERDEKAESCADRNTNAAGSAGLRQEPPSGSRTSAWAEASHGLQCRVTSAEEHFRDTNQLPSLPLVRRRKTPNLAVGKRGENLTDVVDRQPALHRSGVKPCSPDLSAGGDVDRAQGGMPAPGVLRGCQ